jgi:hypothetical protein
MSDLVQQLRLPGDDHSEETKYVIRMKERLLAHPKERGDQICFTFKIPRALHGRLLSAVDDLDLAISDVLWLHLEDVLPLLQRAKNVPVRGWEKDHRLKPGRRRKKAPEGKVA